MTGFGAGSASRGGVRISVELRALNNRFADVRMRLPSELASAEREIRKKVLGRVRRGRVDLSLSLTRDGEVDDGPTLNRPLLDAVIAAGETLRATHGTSGEIDTSRLLSMPGMIRNEQTDLAWDEDDRAALDAALSAALDALDQDRVREGESLAIELRTRVGNLKKLAARIRAESATSAATARDRLIERLNTLAGEVELDPSRVAQEAVVLADRCDVTEEIVRLDGHLEQADKLLDGKKDQPLGKRLEFLVQELLREGNTVGSKSATLELSRLAMEVKVEVEKVREQVQNLE